MESLIITIRNPGSAPTESGVQPVEEPLPLKVRVSPCKGKSIPHIDEYMGGDTHPYVAGVSINTPDARSLDKGSGYILPGMTVGIMQQSESD